MDANTEPLVWDASPRRIVFIAYEGMRLLDLTGPLDAFAIANEMHDATAPAPYSLHVVSERGGMVRTSSGLAVASEPLAALDHTPIDTVIAVGGAAAFRASSGPAAVENWLENERRVLAQPKLLAQARAVKQAELVAMRTADAVITHSPAEAEYLAQEAAGARVHVVGWSIEVSARNVPFARRSGVAFIGSPGHEPNRDAVQLLIEEIMPRVWERDPAIMCEIIGADWPAIFPDALDHRIWLAGSVPDLTTVFDRVRLTVAPLRFGAGIKGKVLESFAAGVPCVMSPVAAEGLALTADLERLVGKSSQQLADLICDLHADGERNAAAGAAGTSMIADAFSFAQVVAGLRSAAKRTTRPTKRSRRA